MYTLYLMMSQCFQFSLFGKIHILFVLLFVCVSILNSQEKETWGLEFSEGKPNVIETTLDLTSEKPITFDKELRLEFDISILQNNTYGNIAEFRDDKNAFRSNLVYYHHTNTDTSYIQLNINGRSSKLIIPFVKKNLHRGTWHSIQLYFERKSRKITMLCDNSHFFSDTVRFIYPPAMNIIFGGYEKERDTPPMIIRDIRIEIDDSPASPRHDHWWKLNEIEGISAIDCVTGGNSATTLPVWNGNNFFRWRQRGVVTVPNDAGGSFSGTKFSFPAKKVMTEYNILTNAITKVTYGNERPSRAIYSVHIQNTVGVYHGGGGQISLLNRETNTWSFIDDRFDDDMHFYGTTKFVDTVNNKAYAFGGYGWHTAKSMLRQFNFRVHQWDTIPLENKSKYSERMNVCIAPANENGKYYVLGGIGNATGKQQDGFNPINDLWSLTLNPGRLKKISDIILPPEVKDISWPSGPMWFVVKNDSVFYCLAKLAERKHDEKETLSVYQIYTSSLDSMMLRAAGEKLYVKNNECLSGIFDSPLTKELIVLRSQSSSATDSVRYEILTLSLPPYRVSEYEYSAAALERTTSAYWYGGFGLLVGITFTLTLFYRKNLQLQPVQRMPVVSGPDRMTDLPVHVSSAINIFGRFEVIDKNGIDISQTFSPLMKQLLVVLIVHSNHKKRPLTTSELSKFFWIDSELDHAKNSRGVALKRLRKLLEHVDDVEIVQVNHLWHILIQQGTRCDYFEYIRLRDSRSGNSEWQHKFVEVAERGMLAHELSYEWLDPVRASLLDDIEIICREIIRSDADEPFKLQTARALLLWDSINENALITVINILVAQKKINLAKEVYKQFCSEYKKIMDKTYSRAFEDHVTR